MIHNLINLSALWKLEVLGRCEVCGYFIQWVLPFLRESQRFWQNVELRKRIRMWQQQSGQGWYCCFHALQKGDINKVVPIDKSSTVLSILLALIFLREGITGTKIVSVLLIGIEGIDSNLGTAIRTTVVLL